MTSAKEGTGVHALFMDVAEKVYLKSLAASNANEPKEQRKSFKITNKNAKPEEK